MLAPGRETAAAAAAGEAWATVAKEERERAVTIVNWQLEGRERCGKLERVEGMHTAGEEEEEEEGWQKWALS